VTSTVQEFEFGEFDDPPLAEPPTNPPSTARLVDGEQFIFCEPDEIPALWGSGDRVAWVAGEPLMIVGPEGVGKTTIAQQLVRYLIGLKDGDFLGMPVAPSERRVLYIAADRSRQAARSFKRMSSDADRAILRDRLAVWKGPLPFDITESPKQLATFTAEHGANTLVIDSLKDVALDLSKDETGTRVNLAFQETIAAGIELAALHHQRKEQQGGGKPRRLADVYGSRWLTAGCGSVVCLWGEPGDLVVELTHLKQPAEDIGPFKIVHDHAHGVSTLYETDSIDALVAGSKTGVTVTDAAGLWFGTDKPEANQREKARRKLEGLITRKLAYCAKDLDGTSRYFPTDGAA
jgi:KaiC/GvpD/RAD55 family RecA-like ATPase